LGIEQSYSRQNKQFPTVEMRYATSKQISQGRRERESRSVFAMVTSQFADKEWIPSARIRTPIEDFSV